MLSSTEARPYYPCCRYTIIRTVKLFLNDNIDNMPDISVDTRMANAKPSTKQGAKHRVKKTIAKVQCSAFRKQMNRSGDTSVPPALPLLTASYALKHIGAWVGLMPDEGSIPQTLDFDDSNSTFMSNTLASCNPDFLDHRHDLLDVRARVARHSKEKTVAPSRLG